MGAGVKNWGYEPTTKKWVPLRVDADGSIHVVGYVDLLSDIGDVTVAGIADGMCIYWDAGTSTWKVKQFLPLAGGTLVGNLVMDAGGLKIILANDDVIQLGTLDGSPTIRGGRAAFPTMLIVQPKDGDNVGEVMVMPSGTQDYSCYCLYNASDLDNYGFIDFYLKGTVLSILGDKVGTGTAPNVFRIKLNTRPANDTVYSLGTAAYRWLDIYAKHHNIQSITGNDHTFSGIITTDIQAGENLAFGDAVYMKADGKAWKADADGAATMPIFGIAVATIAADAAGEILTSGWIRDDTFSLTAGGIVYANVTPGAISTTAPVGSGDQVQVIGIAKTTKIIHFNPSYELVEIS